ncbi:MFS transporter [Puniceibacterium sediminis]|uniref:Sugar phosphate permease n=1 Tax=Puniceibacterium sediminis TaxID=1608407 RepID=A0A238VU38_9RHOB|nr:MFS transporter [Puniceibacterium sediminis]SNR36999.1 Sugar phosphate permease [Puniceibacterium sediminis]
MTTISFLRDNARWLAAGAMLSFLSSFGQTFFIAVFSGEIREAFGLSNGAWGGIYSLGTTCSAIAMVWAGGLTDHYRSRALGAFVLCLLGSACLFMAINPVAALLPVVIFTLRFFGQGMTSHIAVVSMSRWFLATRGKALSVAGLGIALGEAVLPITFVSLMLFIDWRLLWVFAAVVALAAIPLLFLLLRQERTPQSMAETDQSAGMEGRHWRRNEVFRNPLFWFMVPALLGPPAFSTAFFFHQVHYAGIKGWEHLSLVTMFPIFTLVGVGSMIASGWALDRFGTPRVLPWFQLPAAVAFLFFAQTGTLGGAFVGLMFLGLTQGMQSTLPNAFWAEFFGTRHLGSIKAMGAAVMVFGTAIGPGLTGVLIDAGVSLNGQYVAVSAYFIFTTVMMLIGIRRARPLLTIAPA